MITLYRNARLIDARGDRYGDLCTENGIITFSGPLCWQRADRVIDMRRNALMPAFIDTSSLLSQPRKPAGKARGTICGTEAERAFQIRLNEFEENGIPLTQLSAMLSHDPAKRLGLKAGLLAPGYAANLVEIAVEEAREPDSHMILPRSHDATLRGSRLTGRILRTIIDGEPNYAYNTAI